jgi:hypothetical protein
MGAQYAKRLFISRPLRGSSDEHLSPLSDELER